MLRSPTFSESAAVLALGAGLLIITLLSLTEPNVGFARTRWTALLAMLLAAPVLVSHARHPGPHRDWRRAFWTAAALVYLAHFWWATFRTFGGDFAAIAERQGFVAYTNYAVTLLWSVDAALCWSDCLSALRWTRWLRIFAQLLVGTSFIAATAVFRSGLSQFAGIVLALAIATALLAQYARGRDSAAAG